MEIWMARHDGNMDEMEENTDGDMNGNTEGNIEENTDGNMGATQIMMEIWMATQMDGREY